MIINQPLPNLLIKASAAAGGIYFFNQSHKHSKHHPIPDTIVTDKYHERLK